MDAIYIINTKNREILLFKEYTSSTSPRLTLQSFLITLDTYLTSSPSPYLQINNTTIIPFQIKTQSTDILYVILTSTNDIYIPSYNTILSNLNHTLTTAFKTSPTPTLIRDNIILILLMIDHYIPNGIPLLSDQNVLTTLVSPYKLTDKIGEKIIGIAKTYNTITLDAYVNNAQIEMNADFIKYRDELCKSLPQLLFDYIDYVNITCDKKFNILNNTCYSEINIKSDLPNNTPINILLNIPYEIISCSVDNSVNTKTKEIIKKKNVDCTCRHGEYTLMNIVPNLSNNFIQLPFTINADSNINNDKLNIHIDIQLKKIKEDFHDVENVSITILFNTSNNQHVKNSNLSANIGEFEFEENKNCCKWYISKLSSSIIGNTNGVLKGSVLLPGNNISCECLMNMKGICERYSVSGGNLVKVTVPDKDKYVISKFSTNKTIINGLEIIF